REGWVFITLLWAVKVGGRAPACGGLQPSPLLAPPDRVGGLKPSAGWRPPHNTIPIRHYDSLTMLEIEIIACPICETRDHERTYYDERLPTRFVRCQRCRSVYLNPRPGAAPREEYYRNTDRGISSQLRVAESREPAFRSISATLHRH